MPTDDTKLDKILSHLDSAHKKMDELSTKHSELCSRMDKLEAQGATAGKTKVDDAQPSAADVARVDQEMRNTLADDQMRIDRAYQACLSRQAPFPVFGESRRDFRVRLLRPLQVHSKAFANANLSAIEDEAAFSAAETAIIDDAVKASCASTPGMPLRKVTRTGEGGHRVTEFYGDPMGCWAPFMGSQTRIGRIVTPATKHY